MHTVHAHFEALEADWQHYYHADLRACLWGADPWGYRRVAALLHYLPADAALWRSAGTAWTTTDELAAVQIELLDSFRRLYIQAHSKQGSRLPDPVNIPRPWQRKEGRRRSGTSLAELVKTMKLPVKTTPGGDA